MEFDDSRARQVDCFRWKLAAKYVFDLTLQCRPLYGAQVSISFYHLLDYYRYCLAGRVWVFVCALCVWLSSPTLFLYVSRKCDRHKLAFMAKIQMDFESNFSFLVEFTMVVAGKPSRSESTHRETEKGTHLFRGNF